MAVEVVETLDSMLDDKVALDGGGWTSNRWPRWRPLDGLPRRVVLEWMIQRGEIASRVRRGIIEVDLDNLKEYAQRNQRARRVLREIVKETRDWMKRLDSIS